MIEDDDDLIDDDGDDLSPGEAWSNLSRFINVDELLDEIAPASRESSHAKRAYELVRQASDNTIPTLDARLFVIDARRA